MSNYFAPCINDIKDLELINIQNIDVIKGDILNVTYWIRNFKYKFEGICLSIKSKNWVNKNISIILRNVIELTGVEIISSFFFHRFFLNNVAKDYRRKFLFYRSAKLTYLRTKLNQATKI